ncbi:MAG: glycosyltransferase family 2 protein, partial [Actinobacteria bacterium]|nr:glycosyltransferase family 2 protein [Actinomycetota bacterium]
AWPRRVDLFYERMLATLPSLDVVVLTHGNAELTQRCLASLADDTSYPYQLIVVDNASTDDTGTLLDQAEKAGALVIRNETNAGFARGLSQGIEAGSGRYVLLLNNDTEVPRGGLLAFAHGLARSREVGLLGPVTNSTGNEAEIYVPYEPGASDAMSEWFQLLSWERYGLVFDLKAAALFAAIVRRDDFEAAGGLPERYQVGMFEDDELSERIRGLGKRVVCAEDVFVHHYGRAVFRTLDPVVYQAIFDRNRRVFESAVGAPWQPHTHRPNKNRTLGT